jgi:hypothetical protein
VVNYAAQKSSEHTSRECHEAAETEQISDKAGRKGNSHAVKRSEQNCTDNIDHMLYRGAFAAEYREREKASNDSHGAKQTCKR